MAPCGPIKTLPELRNTDYLEMQNLAVGCIWKHYLSSLDSLKKVKVCFFKFCKAANTNRIILYGHLPCKQQIPRTEEMISSASHPTWPTLLCSLRDKCVRARYRCHYNAKRAAGDAYLLLNSVKDKFFSKQNRYRWYHWSQQIHHWRYSRVRF